MCILFAERERLVGGETERERERFFGREEEENKLGKKKERLVGENHIKQKLRLKTDRRRSVMIFITKRCHNPFSDEFM